MNLHDLPPGDGSLLLTTDDLKMSLSDYLDRMNRLVSCPAELQRVMFEYLYFGRDLIVHRKRMLPLSYNVFIGGLTLSLLLFMVASVWF